MIETLVKDVFSAYKDMPREFANDILDMKLIWEGQQRVLNSIRDNKRTTVPSGHSTGKSAIAAAITLWWLSTHFNSRVLATAPTFRQLINVYYAEINKWYNKSAIKPLKMFDMKAHHMNINIPQYSKEWFMLPISPKSPDALQGQHGDKSADVELAMESLGISEIKDDIDIKKVIEMLKGQHIKNGDDNLLIIIDEASGVSQEILEVLEGTDYTKLVMFGNMTKNTGMFYDSVYRNKGEFNVVRLSSYDSPFMSYEQIEYMERKYGKDSNVIKVRLKGDCPDSENDTILSRSLLESYVGARIPTEKEHSKAELNIGNDVARFGDDKTVIYVREGSYIINTMIYGKQDTMQTCGYIANIAKNDKRRIYARIDGVGVGGGVIDRLKEIGLPNLSIIEIHNNGNAQDEKEYADLITEMFFYFKGQLEEGRVSMPDDVELIEDLSGRKYGFDSKGRLKVESKDSFKERFKRSPDKGDAFLQCWYNKKEIWVL